MFGEDQMAHMPHNRAQVLPNIYQQIYINKKVFQQLLSHLVSHLSVRQEGPDVRSSYAHIYKVQAAQS